MQYFQPKPGYFVGDAMPFFHDGIFHFIFLLDEGHHLGLGGLGGHQWDHYTSRDLKHWEHQPLLIPISEETEGSICTGSLFFDAGVYHAFFSTRRKDFVQYVSHAESTDGIHFTKTRPNPLISSPEGFLPKDFRDPFVFKDEKGVFQMLVTTRLAEFPLHDRGGCVLRFSSHNLRDWKQEDIFLTPGGPYAYASIPECPDYFFWNGWHYLTFGQQLQTRYRMSRHASGPWLRPPHDVLGGTRCAVMKTTPFGPDRRIGAAWIGSRKDDKDNGDFMWGGNAVFREIVQNDDGTLGTKFPSEMVPATGAPLTPVFKALTSGVRGDCRAIAIDALEGQEAGYFESIPQNYRLQCVMHPTSGTFCMGLGLRGSGAYATKYDFRIECHARTAHLASESTPLDGDTHQARRIDLVVMNDIIDICVDDRRCLINRLPELKGDRLFFFCENGSARFEQISLHPLE